MTAHRRRSHFVRALAVLTLVACGDDDKRSDMDEDPSAAGDAATADASTTPGSDAGTGRDAAVTNDSGSEDLDGSASPLDARAPDAAGPSGDAASNTGDATIDPGASGDASALDDGGGQSVVDASVLDASVGDAASAGDAAGGSVVDAEVCEVRDRRFGCGVVRGSLVEFQTGYTVDRETRLVWAPKVDPLSDNQETDTCNAETFNGVDEFVLPTIDQVRTLTAGCSASCRLASESCTGQQCNEECLAEACTAGGGPHASGGYCRSELVDCLPMFTRDSCNIGDFSDCSVHQHWYFDPSTGVFRLVGEGQRVAGRCVARLRGMLP